MLSIWMLFLKIRRFNIMPKYQVIERDGAFAIWSMPRTQGTSDHFEKQDDAVMAAKKYVTSVNVENALAEGEQEASAELYMMDDVGAFLGFVNGKSWYMRYKKDQTDPKDRAVVLHKKDEIVKDRNYFELSSKGEVSVREVPGT